MIRRVSDRSWFLLAVIVLFVCQSAIADTADDKPTDDLANDPAVVAVRKLGGTVRAMARDSESLEVEFHVGGRDLNDDGLKRVAALKRTVSLNLRGTKITDAGLKHLKGLTSLRRLHLERTSVGDAGVAHLAGLVELEYLNLYGTKITDEALGRLTGLKKLRRLYVWQTGVTDAGVARLQKVLPKLKVSRGVDLSKLPAYKPVEVEPVKPEVDLKWMATTRSSDAPKSRTGSDTKVIFENKSGKRVKVYWVSYDDQLKLYGTIEIDGQRTQNTYSNSTWLITDENEKPMGFFLVGVKLARAVIPKAK